MIRRITRDALKEQADEYLQASLQGYIRELEAFSASLKSWNKLKMDDDDLITETVMSSLSARLFEGIVFMGKLEYEISKSCDITEVEWVGDDLKKEDEYVEKAERCLKIVNMYAHLGVLRIISLIQVAVIMQPNDGSLNGQMKLSNC